MLKCLFVYGVLGVLPIPANSNQISVCVEDDNDVRVDCRTELQLNMINSYEFSWSSGTKESLINTNVSGLPAEGQYKGKSHVEKLKPQGFRMTLTNYRDKHPHNTTYLCKVSGVVARVNVEKDDLARCSAVSMFLKSSCSWIVCGLLFLYKTHM